MISAKTAEAAMRSGLQHPRDVLGPHMCEGGIEVVSFLPTAKSASILVKGKKIVMKKLGNGIFSGIIPDHASQVEYKIECVSNTGKPVVIHDPFAFSDPISEHDLFLLKKGDLRLSYNTLGSHSKSINGVKGVTFRVWAPNASSVSVIGDFNNWIVGTSPMDNANDSGIWELFIPDIGVGSLYKYAIKTKDDGRILEKADPYAFEMELRPHTASVVSESHYLWKDKTWIQKRKNPAGEPMAVYEVHLGSWKRDGGSFMNYRDLAPVLLKHVKSLGFNYVELLPVMEHPLDASWGYQVTEYYAPSSRFGKTDDFKYFVDYMHKNNVGVILDWVPAHFPSDDFALSLFDGTHLYEHEDPRLGSHPDWGTLIFNYARNEVRCFLLSNAIYWIREFHADGLRVDAVSSMLYLDYSRKPGQWLPNKYGGNENLDAISFLRDLNDLVHEEYPGVLLIAEESTAWPGVTWSTRSGGLGFDLKWNMGWMHDTLEYFSLDPVYRKYHQNKLTFAMWYAFNEKFILPISHDEVVYGKGSLLGKMPGDNWQKFANLRLFFAYMFSFPGKKMLFMGSEFGQEREWNHDVEIEWYMSEKDANSKASLLLHNVSELYSKSECLYDTDFENSTFEWIDFSDAEKSIISFIRYNKPKDDFLVCVFNFTPVPHHGYSVGVPKDGYYKEIINTDSKYYGGSGQGNYGGVNAEEKTFHGRKFSIPITVPPLAAVIFHKEVEHE